MIVIAMNIKHENQQKNRSNFIGYENKSYSVDYYTDCVVYAWFRYVSRNECVYHGKNG